MLRIECPWCGLRDQTEFHCGGEANLVRPVKPAKASDQTWADYLFFRENIKGLHQERWVHIWGCRQWFTVSRDTVSHEIVPIHGLDEVSNPPPRPLTSEKDSES
jgi:sarcosine oxidase subunit delta